MLPRTHRLSTRDIWRLFWRTTTQKIPAYPFVFFVWTHPLLKNTKRWIQLSTKLSKSSVKRHVVKRAFYDCIKDNAITLWKPYTILAVPQKNWQEEIVQLLATGSKNDIVSVLKKQFTTCLSSFVKKLWSSAESKKQ
jgi:RNase P protein component